MALPNIKKDTAVDTKGQTTNWGIGPFSWEGPSKMPDAIADLKFDMMKGYVVNLKSKVLGFTIEAILLEQIGFNISAQWGGNSDSISKIAGNLSSYVNEPVNSGKGFTWTGFATRRFYTGGSNISITVKMRLIESDCQEQLQFPRQSESVSEDPAFTPGLTVVQQLTQILSLALPRVEAEVTMEDVKNTLSDVLAKIPGLESLTDWLANKARDVVDTLAAKTGDIGAAVKNVVAGAKETLASADFQQSRDPGNVEVAVGDWFFINDGIVTGIQVQPSKQMTINGPLYCDVSLTIETRENPYLSKGSGVPEQGKLSFNSFGMKQWLPQVTPAELRKQYQAQQEKDKKAAEDKQAAADAKTNNGEETGFLKT